MAQARQQVPAGKTLVRTAIRPYEDTLVDIDEVAILQQQGLLAEDKPAAAGQDAGTAG